MSRDSRIDIVRFDQAIGESLRFPTAEAARQLAAIYRETNAQDAFVMALIGRLLLELNMPSSARGCL